MKWKKKFILIFKIAKKKKWHKMKWKKEFILIFKIAKKKNETKWNEIENSEM